MNAMDARLPFHILPQPDDTTCGPTCLHAVYRHWGDDIDLREVISGSRALEGGGTLAVFLADHALRRGYRATIYPYNVQLFDPTWFDLDRDSLLVKLRAQMATTRIRKRKVACQAYLEFLELGGELEFEDLTGGLLRRHLGRGVPVLTGLSSTWLYRDVRENPRTFEDDDVGGAPAGHFVVLVGYEKKRRTIWVADPYRDNPLGSEQIYEVPIERVMNAILLGIVTYDANLLVIEPGGA